MDIKDRLKWGTKSETLQMETQRDIKKIMSDYYAGKMTNWVTRDVSENAYSKNKK